MGAGETWWVTLCRGGASHGETLCCWLLAAARQMLATRTPWQMLAMWQMLAQDQGNNGCGAEARRRMAGHATVLLQVCNNNVHMCAPSWLLCL